jgi:hypothetical protein
MGRWAERYPLVPWSDIARDLYEANNGEVELYRDTHSGTQAERQIGVHVVGQYDSSVSLGLVAIRCERHGERLVPLTISIAETPPFIDTRSPILIAHSNPVRHLDEGDSA